MFKVIIGPMGRIILLVLTSNIFCILLHDLYNKAISVLCSHIWTKTTENTQNTDEQFNLKRCSVVTHGQEFNYF